MDRATRPRGLPRHRLVSAAMESTGDRSAARSGLCSGLLGGGAPNCRGAPCGTRGLPLAPPPRHARSAHLRRRPTEPRCSRRCPLVYAHGPVAGPAWPRPRGGVGTVGEVGHCVNRLSPEWTSVSASTLLEGVAVVARREAPRQSLN